MAFFQIEYSSEVLGQYRQVDVLYPDMDQVSPEEAMDTDIPVLYLLHGMGGNQNSWTSRTNLQRLVRKTNLIIIMPNSDNGWYTDTRYGVNYYRAICHELPKVMKRFFPNMTDKREKTFIAGLSMGGYGAFKLAMISNQFAFAGSFSGALYLDKSLRSNTEDDRNYWSGLFGSDEDFDASANNLLEAAKEADGKTKWYAWCGYEDFLYPANEKAIADFRKLGMEIDYRNDHGTHDWYYWEKQVEVFLEMLPINYVKEERLS
ncbi:alpha/beta hydrolase [Streptococcus loxodontisalivarius]|uniref:Tributyrin esterase n=1 Tax=Streptococcus loxodontisalivarius TaxID=1349415 RepID=A0ABS2PPC2_9STRE|nr:alpha/beta hydrolase family protein [Streptococcus loxodontisalivarius]MBM7641721.1 putative tributyrin esterase [Streptococcus loxodontisalivarius]